MSSVLGATLGKPSGAGGQNRHFLRVVTLYRRHCWSGIFVLVRQYGPTQTGRFCRFSVSGFQLGGAVVITTCGPSCHKTAYPDNLVSPLQKYLRQTLINITVWAVRADGPYSGFSQKHISPPKLATVEKNGINNNFGG